MKVSRIYLITLLYLIFSGCQSGQIKELDVRKPQEIIPTLENLIKNKDFRKATDIGVSYLKKDYDDKIHELVINAIWDNGLSFMDLDELIIYFPNDFRNYVVRADANIVSFYTIGDGMFSENELSPEFSVGEKVSPKIAKAIDDYKTAISLNPEDDYIYGMLAWAIWEKGDIVSTEKTYLKAIEIAPHNPFGYYMIGYFYNYEGKLDDALLSYEKALKLDKESEIVKESFKNIIDKHYHKIQKQFSKHIPQSIDEVRFSSLQKIIKIYEKKHDDEKVDVYFEKLCSEFPGCKKKEKFKKYKKRIESI